MSLYDRIGNNYSRTRRTDPRIQAAISNALSGCKLVLNVGAGTGSYEPKDRQVVSLDPSFVMLEQRQDRSNVIRGIAELLPFSNQSFDAAMVFLPSITGRTRASGSKKCREWFGTRWSYSPGTNREFPNLGCGGTTFIRVK